jgi:hypothetical protein
MEGSVNGRLRATVVGEHSQSCASRPLLALLITSTKVADITTGPLSHFEMKRQVHTKMHRWSQNGAIFVS